MLLQPIVENAIIHGVSEIENGNITIRFQLKINMLEIEIIDNGEGIKYTNFEEIVNDGRQHIGLRNVKARIESYYGNAAKMLINKSSHGRGTIITLIIPACKKLT